MRRHEHREGLSLKGVVAVEFNCVLRKARMSAPQS
jgi:hypothetical protein